jgi:hypothetical protein
MTKDDIICVLIVYACDKVVKTYCHGGWLMYFTEKYSNRIAMSWSGFDFKKFAEAENKINQHYDEVFISVFQFDSEPYYVEHNELLTAEDIKSIIEVVSGMI